ncbi:hypothetical protein COTS27_01033 [Spirochaetota bacterium]|nr:hypothetical protein COTS27_01033 [Spirochaetota bacterium]
MNSKPIKEQPSKENSLSTHAIPNSTQAIPNSTQAIPNKKTALNSEDRSSQMTKQLTNQLTDQLTDQVPSQLTKQVPSQMTSQVTKQMTNPLTNQKGLLDTQKFSHEYKREGAINEQAQLQAAAVQYKTKRERLLKEPERLGHYLGYQDLGSVHGEWIRKIWQDNLTEDRLILAHRNSYKTTAIIIVGVMWYLLFHPNATILIARKEYKGAAAMLARIRRHYLAPKVASLYSQLGIAEKFSLTVAKENTLSLSTKTVITQEGNIEVIGTSAKGITGRHYDRIHLDDVVTEHDRDSTKERIKTIRFYENLKSVIKPGNAITATGTPWHKHDLYKKFGHVDRYPLGSINIKAFTAEQIKAKQQELSPAMFASQYQLTHISDHHNLFLNVKRSSTWDVNARTLGHIDPAFGGTHTSAFTLVQFTQSRILVIGHVFTGHIRKHYEKIKSLIKKYHVTGTYIETNADKGALLYDLQRQGLMVWGYHEAMNKHIKIMTLLYQYWQHLYFHKDCDMKYIGQIEDYNERALLDDAPDSLASLLMKCGRTFLAYLDHPTSYAATKQFNDRPEQRLHWVRELERGVVF